MAHLTKIVKSCFSSIRRVLEQFHLLEKKSRVVVAVSGGVDSLVLLYLLNEYNQKFSQNWEIFACHIDPKFPNWDIAKLERCLKREGVEYKIIDTDIHNRIKNLSKKCFFCARERRYRLLEYAESINAFQIALAHHLEDVVETFIMNICYNGEISAMVPKQGVIQGRFFFVRPMYYIEKKQILAIADILGIPENMNLCPYYRLSKREKIRNFLKEIENEYPDVYKAIFNGMRNIKFPYLFGY